MLEIMLIAVIIIQSIIHFVERRDMYNRLMSKNLSEYKQNGKPPEHIPSAHDRVLKNWRNKKAGDR
jgi:hypothetical protein